MNKRIIVVEDCRDCQYSALGFLTRGHVCLYEVGEPRDCPDKGTPDWCQLPSIPEYADEEPYQDEDSFIANTFEAGFATGWNTCIRTMLEEVET